MIKAYFKELFSFTGRWNRKKFWFFPLILIIILLIERIIIFPIIFISLLGLASIESVESIGSFAAIILLHSRMALSYLIRGALVVVLCFAYMKRLRDLDKNPWMTLLMIVPFANIYLLIICGFFKGTVGPNRYGPDPLGNPGDTSSTGDITNVEL